MGKKLEKYVN